MPEFTDPVFVIEFYGEDKGPPTRVWSDDMDKIHMFMKQHCFDMSKVKKYTLYPNDVKHWNHLVQPDGELLLYNLNSSSDNKIHSICTSDEIIDFVTRSLADDLVESLMFGGIIARLDVGFVKRICTLIESLSYAAICDWELIADDIVDRYYDEDYYLGINQYPEFKSPTDTSWIYDALFDKRMTNHILPITLEAYVHYFVYQMIGE